MDGIDFAALSQEDDAVVLSALKGWEPREVKRFMTHDLPTKYPGRIVEAVTIGELPQPVQEKIFSHVQDHLETIRSLGKVQLAQHGELVPPRVVKEAGYYRGEALRRLFDYVGEVAFYMVGKKPKGTPLEELTTAAALFDGGQEGPGALTPDGLSKHIMQDVDVFKVRMRDFVTSSMESVRWQAGQKAELEARLASEAKSLAEGNLKPITVVESTNAHLMTPEVSVGPRNLAAEPAIGNETRSVEGAAGKLVGWFKQLHWGNKLAIVGGTVALGATVGYWAFRTKSEQRSEQHAR